MVVRCRTGTQLSLKRTGVPDQRCIVSRYALTPHCVRDKKASQLPQRHVLDHVALALLQDQVGTLPRRQDVLVQVDEIDAVPD